MLKPLDFKSLNISSISNLFLYSVTAFLLFMLVAKYHVSSESTALHTTKLHLYSFLLNKISLNFFTLLLIGFISLRCLTFLLSSILIIISLVHLIQYFQPSSSIYLNKSMLLNPLSANNKTS